MSTRFHSGQRVKVLPYGSTVWREAVVDRPAPYAKGGCDGAYVFYVPLPTVSWESAGGWYPANAIEVLP